MSGVLKRYFVVTGPSVRLMERLKTRRDGEMDQANELAEEHGFECSAFSESLGMTRLVGFLAHPDDNLDLAETDRFKKKWKRLGMVSTDGRSIWVPKRNSSRGRELSDRMDRMKITGRTDMIALFGLENWEVTRPTDRGLMVSTASCGKFSDAWVVSVPEEESSDFEPFRGHEDLREITPLEFRKIQRGEITCR